VLRCLSLISALAATLAVGACGNKHEVVTHGETEGVYIDVGELKYQVQISRQLNPADIEDRTYLTGIAPEDREMKNGEVWFAVFIRVQNETKETRRPAEEYEIEDTQENVYRPLELATTNPFAYRPLPMPPKSLIPKIDSIAAEGTVQGSLLLFKIPGPSLDNRPLEFVIKSPVGGDDGTVALDI
jgi:hypothetical protein